ncbi:MAG: hypothetical protein NZ480_09630 [Bdellovibrionaceae bacterium]|nr:hypothetical protein [Pseudobdellovibrionaceae bacterium]MDW8190752.1 hypothetical protein [Pseudobdellovibrionaceae bacterium]
MVVKRILDLLFGKEPDIFNEQGKVQHKLPRAYWEAWEKRFKDNPEYNWRLHHGQQRRLKNTH